MRMPVSAVAKAGISRDPLQDNPGTPHKYSMPDLVEIDSNADDENDDDSTDGNEITGVLVSNRPSASPTRNASHVPQTPIPPSNPPTSTTRNEPCMLHMLFPTRVPPRTCIDAVLLEDLNEVEEASKKAIASPLLEQPLMCTGKRTRTKPRSYNVSHKYATKYQYGHIHL